MHRAVGFGGDQMKTPSFRGKSLEKVICFAFFSRLIQNPVDGDIAGEAGTMNILVTKHFTNQKQKKT